MLGMKKTMKQMKKTAATDYGRVFVNRTLNMKRVSHLGLDQDHTLVRYNSENFEGLAYRIMCEKLVKEKGYPQSLLQLKFEFNRAIRGLVIDRAKGNLLKLSRHSAIRTSYHGTQPINFSDQNKIYKSTYIDLKDKAYDKVDTTFSISYAALYAQLVDMKDSGNNKLPSFSKIAEDLNSALDAAHRDGSIKNEVKEDVPKYILKTPAIVKGLERYVKHGKKIFIVTNSEFFYSKLLLDYAINPFLKNHDHWSDLFTYVITFARKPSFFIDDTPFLSIDPETGKKSAYDKPLVPGIYEGGCAKRFTDGLNLASDEILYIGDHIYGDVVRLKKDCAWRTALIVEELENEVKQLKKVAPYVEQINELMSKKIPLEREIDQLISRKIESGKGQSEHAPKSASKGDAKGDSKGDTKGDSKIERLIKKSQEIDKKIQPLIKKQTRQFNPYWGEIMRVGIEESYFAHQVERFACVYMSRLDHLLEVSPRTYFRSLKRPLPHEL